MSESVLLDFKGLGLRSGKLSQHKMWRRSKVSDGKNLQPAIQMKTLKSVWW